MLQIHTDLLPQTLLSFVAFRLAYRVTAQTLCDHGADWDSAADNTGLCAYLGEVPFLREVTLPVQLELLGDTWQRHLSTVTHQATLLDESVLYAACEFSARICERSPELVLWSLRGGPLDVTVPVDDQLASELRRLYLRLSNDGDFLLISQFLDLPPAESLDWKQRLRLDSARTETLFETLGRWHTGPGVTDSLQSLITPAEATWLNRLLRRQ